MHSIYHQTTTTSTTTTTTTSTTTTTTAVCLFTDVQISFEQSLYTVAESGGSRIVTVVLDKPSAVPIPLQYSTVDDTATGKYCTISLVTALSHKLLHYLTSYCTISL